MKLSQLLNTKEKWTSNCLGKRADGASIYSFDVLYTNKSGKDEVFDPQKEIKAYSLQGAVVSLYNSGARNQIMDKLRDGIYTLTGKNMSVAAYNDMIDQTFENIEKLLKVCEL